LSIEITKESAMTGAVTTNDENGRESE
jgi:hypothetical protein